MQPEILKFKVDENLPEAAARIFREAGFDAETVLTEGLGGASDATLAAICKEEGRTLVTLDLDFSDIRHIRLKSILALSYCGYIITVSCMYQQLLKKLWGCCNVRSLLAPSGVLMNDVSGYTVIDAQLSR
ncbi:MAG: DUF5615 family PIN-like protein [Deltaproteobacteria bacterium]|nr:DUF5615 family PIN-like protein [Deltaproteobacteria bacterium]